MVNIQKDDRTENRKALDEIIASQPQIPLLDAKSGVPLISMPVEFHLAKSRVPVAIAGIVENGVIKLIEPNVTLPDRTRVIVVANGTL